MSALIKLLKELTQMKDDKHITENDYQKLKTGLKQRTLTFRTAIKKLRSMIRASEQRRLEAAAMIQSTWRGWCVRSYYLGLTLPGGEVVSYMKKEYGPHWPPPVPIWKKDRDPNGAWYYYPGNRHNDRGAGVRWWNGESLRDKEVINARAMTPKNKLKKQIYEH